MKYKKIIFTIIGVMVICFTIFSIAKADLTLWYLDGTTLKPVDPTWTVVGVSGGGSNWQFSGINAITPTTTIGLIVNGSSTFVSTLTSDGGFIGDLTGTASGNPSYTYASSTYYIQRNATTTTDYWGSQRANTHLSWSTSGFDVDDDFVLNTSDTMSGYLTAAGFTGKASTTAALAANPTNCSANQYPSGIDASGNVESCTADANTTYTAGDALTLTDTDFDFDGGDSPGGSLGGTWANPTIDDLFVLNTSDTMSGYLIAVGFTGNASTADALKANPTDCSAGQFATTIAANGDLTCATAYDALADISLTEGYIIVGNNAGAAMATSSIFINADNGNVGIGTTTPSSLFSVGTGFQVGSTGIVTNGTWQGGTIGLGYGGTGLTSVTAGYVLIGSLATALQATSSLYINPAGYVGISSTTPTSLLSVGGDMYITGEINTPNGEMVDFHGFSKAVASSTWQGMGTSSDFFYPPQRITITEIACIEKNANATNYGTTTVYLTDGTNALDSIACGYTLVKDSTLTNNTWNADEKMTWVLNKIEGTPNGFVLRVKFYYLSD